MSVNSSTFNIPEIEVESLANRLAASPDLPYLLDVREPQEVAIASVPGFENWPLSAFAEWSAQIGQRLDASREIYVMCHHGIRSAQVCQWLIHQGFSCVYNVAGGIDAYSRCVDASIPRY